MRSCFRPLRVSGMDAQTAGKTARDSRTSPFLGVLRPGDGEGTCRRRVGARPNGVLRGAISTARRSTRDCRHGHLLQLQSRTDRQRHPTCLGIGKAHRGCRRAVSGSRRGVRPPVRCGRDRIGRHGRGRRTRVDRGSEHPRSGRPPPVCGLGVARLADRTAPAFLARADTAA